MFQTDEVTPSVACPFLPEEAGRCSAIAAPKPDQLEVVLPPLHWERIQDRFGGKIESHLVNPELHSYM